MKAVPVINENDTVATSEIRYGDNDRLAARVATMMGADLLVLLSDIDGLYTAPPALDPNAQLHRRWSTASRPRSRRWRVRPPPSCRAAACAPSSTPARSPPRPARAMIIAAGNRLQSAGGDRARRALDLLPAERQPGARLQELDRRPARTGRPADRRCRRGRRAAVRQVAAAGRRQARQRQFRARRHGGDLSIRTAARSRAGWLPTTPPMP